MSDCDDVTPGVWPKAVGEGFMYCSFRTHLFYVPSRRAWTWSEGGVSMISYNDKCNDDDDVHVTILSQ